MFASCVSLFRLVLGEQLHGNVLSLSVSNSMIFLSLDYASVLFQKMRCKDTISSTTVIIGYSQAGFGEEGFKYFSWMRQGGTKLTDDALDSFLSDSGYMTFLEQCVRQFHALALALHLGLDQKSTIHNSLIIMYSKCGSIIEASKILEATAMINGYAVHRKAKEAIHQFEKSLTLGFRPDTITFASVFTACSHLGQLGLGFHFSNLMQDKYNMRPDKQHYGCMGFFFITGKWKEAENVRKNMKSKGVIKEFKSGDRLHPQSEDIYSILELV
ncbi:hypothetical protein EUTSA_v10003103mg [Eutrema salsugineum]|uniref:Pentatricopeptide repeat-containing protein n=1 Tax=Eutrema salsugineum TaxID=72664 RepID=V4KGY8_EUTSA|nr:hypothetical protein EUTSA_v10003103mg [Eutrema salsugineum]